MKVMQIVNALPSLQKLAGQELTLQKSYKIFKLMGRLDNELAFYNEQKGKILAKYCDIQGEYAVPIKEYEERLNAELNELLNTEVEGEIKEVVLDTNEDIKLSYNDIVALQGFVRIDEAE